jgi:hypothetical protein
MTNAYEYADSAFSFNCWANVIDLGVKNIACIAGKTTEPDSYEDIHKCYSYYFVKSNFTVPVPSAIKQSTIKNIKIFSQNGFIIVKGDIQGKPVEVYNVLGKLIHQINASSPELYIKADKGVYIVKAGNSIAKLVVQ